MTTQEKIHQKEKELEELRIQLEKEKNDPKQFLLDILGNELTIKIDREKYPDSVFYFKGDSCLLELGKYEKELILWVNYYKIWNPITEKLGLKYAEIKDLIKVTVEEHFKMSGVTAHSAIPSIVYWAEEYFKLSGATASQQLKK